MEIIENLTKGNILISEPFLNDPNFKRSIILLSEHNEEGSVGFILNKPTKFKLNEVLDDFPDFDERIYLGGPVQMNTLQFVHRVGALVQRAGELIEGSLEISEGLYWGGNFDYLKLLIEAKQVSPDDFRFFVGYSGWTQGQLMDELKINSWIVTLPTIDDIFSNEPDKMWREKLRSMGKKFAILASFPENPSVN